MQMQSKSHGHMYSVVFNKFCLFTLFENLCKICILSFFLVDPFTVAKQSPFERKCFAAITLLILMKSSSFLLHVYDIKILSSIHFQNA